MEKLPFFEMSSQEMTSDVSVPGELVIGFSSRKRPGGFIVYEQDGSTSIKNGFVQQIGPWM